MTLRTRLLLSVGLLLAVALLVSGALVVGLTRASLVAQVDDELRGVTLQDLDLGPGGLRGRVDPTGRRFALLVLDADGQIVEQWTRASGFARQPDPLPSLPNADEPALPVGRIVERPAVDGKLDYRVLALRARGGELTAVLGAPLREVDQTVRALAVALLLVGALVVIASLLVGWWLIRRNLRPLEQVTETAERISAGDLTRRVGLGGGGGEVNRLGGAFDSMLDQIQTAFERQQAALAAKEESEGRLRRFVADASHELRTPLTTLRGYAELYRAGGLEDEAAIEQAMARIGSESQRMAALVEDLLLLARLDQGRPLRREPVDLSRVVSDAVADSRALEPGRPLAADVEPGVVVEGDEDRLRQVMGNLFANVRMHTPADAPLEVSLVARDGFCRVRLADRGPGIAPEHEARIFDRFYRADAGRSRDRGGSGLGLSIAASVALAHGGRLSYEPTPGGGASFELSLPRA
ncbi:MAG TPA: ATP-binding protein [Candidatus Limnocylindria bacterium]|nr:ATP-binding protein [Candidatus Limnocylindria bacterium]